MDLLLKKNQPQLCPTKSTAPPLRGESSGAASWEILWRLVVDASCKGQEASGARHQAPPFKPLVLGWTVQAGWELHRSLDWAIRRRFLDLVLVINIQIWWYMPDRRWCLVAFYIYISILCFLKVRLLGLIFPKNGGCSSNLGWGPQGFQGYIYIYLGKLYQPHWNLGL